MKRILLLLIISALTVSVMAQKSHSVKQGETIESIAKQYNVTVDEIKKQNPNAELFFPGLILSIPKSTVSNKTVEEAKSKKSDRIEMKDGSYVLCKISGVKSGVVSFKQDGIDQILTLPTKDINLIEYENGNKRRFKK